MAETIRASRSSRRKYSPIHAGIPGEPRAPIHGSSIALWLTPRVESWDPYDEFYADQERSLIDNNGELRLDRTRPRKKSRVDEHLSEDELFGLVSNVQVKHEDGYAAARTEKDAE